MRGNGKIILYGARHNRYSINALLGSLLAAGHRRMPMVFDRPEALLAHARRCPDPPLAAAFSFFSTQTATIASLVRELRQRYGWRLVAGGPHASGDPAGTLAMGFDVVVRGEGEQTLPELLAALAAGRDLATVAGISYRSGNGTFHHTGRRPVVDLDRYPPFAPAWHRFGPIEITRGCPFACRYCQTSFLFGSRVRHRSIETIGELATAMAARGLCDIRVITPNALAYGSPDGRTVVLDAVEALLARLRAVVGQRGRIFFGSFPSEVRPDHLSDQAARLLQRYVDNDNLVIGAQSGSDRLLERCGRGHTTADVVRAVVAARRAGFLPLVDFIFGLPGESHEDREATVRLMDRLTGLGARVHAHTFMPLPQTPFATAPPGRLDPGLRRHAERLVAKGALFGAWQRQEHEAQRLAAAHRGTTGSGQGHERVLQPQTP